VGTGVTNSGADRQYAHAIYFQDAWQVTRGLTLNLCVRFDQERQPPYDPKRFPTVEFGWGDKIAPRIGAAYDLLHNGKVKIYASYGKFYDIMKMGFARSAATTGITAFTPWMMQTLPGLLRPSARRRLSGYGSSARRFHGPLHRQRRLSRHQGGYQRPGHLADHQAYVAA
jgi:hypothetical protein